MKQKQISLPWKRATVLSVLSGLIYNSWPLGYWLNSQVARHDLASELEALHQPYNWLFIACDVISSLLIIITAVWLWRSVRLSRHSKLIVIALANAVAFGVGTIVDALLPLRCDPSVQRCPSLVHEPLLIAHGVFSITASVCLFITIFLMWWLQRRNHIMVSIIIGYVLFGIFSVISLVTPGQDSWAQHYALLLDGVCLAVIPYGINQTLPAKPAAKQESKSMPLRLLKKALAL